MPITPAPPFSFRQVNKLIRKLDLHNGDVILIKAGTALASKEAMGMIADVCKNNAGIDVVVGIVEDFHDLTVLDEPEMNKLGWYRIEALRVMVNRSKRERLAKQDSLDDTDHISALDTGQEGDSVVETDTT